MCLNFTELELFQVDTSHYVDKILDDFPEE